MNLNSLKEIVLRAVNEMDGQRARPSWIAERAMQIADPDKVAPLVVSFAANLEFRQLARECLREQFEPIEPSDPEPPQHPLFPGLQAMYPRRVRADEEPEYVRPELLSKEDISWNVARLRACSDALARRADALEAWARSRAMVAA